MKRGSILAPVVVAAIVLGAWEAICRFEWVSAYLLAPPSAIAQALIDEPSELLEGFLVTGVCALVGFLFSAVLGSAFAVAMVSSDRVYRAFYPYTVVFQTVPIIAVAPLLVIWLGYGAPTVIASAFLASIFPVIMATLTGLLATPSELQDLFTLYGATWKARLHKLIFPMALPGILTGLRIAAGLAVIGAIVGEFIGGGGLGSVIDSARTQQRLDKVFAAVGLASLLGALAIAAIDGISRAVLSRWSPKGHAKPLQ